MKAVLIPADGGRPIKDIELPDASEKTAERVRFLIDGYFQAVKTRTQGQVCTIWCDEDGKMKVGVKINLRAMFLSNLNPPDYLVGDVVLTGGRGTFKECPYSAKQIEQMIIESTVGEVM